MSIGTYFYSDLKWDRSGLVVASHLWMRFDNLEILSASAGWLPMFSCMPLHVCVAFAFVTGKLLCRLMCLSGSTPMPFWKD